MIPDLNTAMKAGLPLFRRQVAPSAFSLPPRPLIAGTELNTDQWLNEWHNAHQSKETRDVACYYAMDAVVSGDGHVWLGESLVTSDEILPRYVKRSLGIDLGGSPGLHAAAKTTSQGHRISVPGGGGSRNQGLWPFSGRASFSAFDWP